MASSALGGFVGGLQQGYSFVQDVKTKQADEARRVKEDARRDQDAEFQQETRDRSRLGWGKEDQYKADVDALNNSFFPPEQKAAPAPALGIQAPPPAAAAPAAAAPAPDMPAADSATGAAAAINPPASAPQIAAPSAPAPAGGVAPASSAFADPTLGLSQPSAASSAPATGTAPPAGLPTQPNKLTNMGASMDYLIQRAQIDMRHGKTDGAGIANLYKLRSSAAKEGINDAVQLLAQGDNEGAMRRFNENGDMKDWHVQSSVDGVFDHAGVKIPTKIVTVQAADGTTRTVNTAQTLVQNQLIDAIVTQAQKGVTMDDTRTDAKTGRKIQQQNADTQEAFRADQAENMREQRRLQQETIDGKYSTPAPIWGKEDDTFLKEQYSGKDEVTGAKTFDGEGLQFAKQVAVARSRFNGGDSATASAYALAADANLKAQAKGDPVKLRELRAAALQKLASAAPARSSTGGAEWDARSVAGMAPEIQADRRATIERELANATNPAHIAGLKRELDALPAPTAAPAAAVRPAAAPATARPVAAPAAVAPAQQSGMQAGHINMSDGSVDVRNDTVIATLRKALAGVDANNPNNTDTMMKLGTAMNQRVEALQANYGPATPLITQ
jgi:hypothetical protein